MLLIHEGSFGQSLDKNFSHLWRNSVTLENALDTLDALDVEAQELVVVVLTNKRIAATRRLDEYFNEHKIRWTLSFLNDRYLYCGPYFVPGESACFDCFHRRDLTHLTHHQTAERELAIESYFSRNMDAEIAGFTLGAGAMAAGLRIAPL